MDALEALRQMHGEAKAAFQRIEQASPDERGGLWARLRPELLAHEQIEERFVYDPVLRDRGSDPMLTNWHRRHEQEVEQANALIDEIGRLDPREARFVERVGELHRALAAHIAMEENEFWPRIRQVWGADRLEQAGRQVEAARTAATAAAGVSGAVGSIAESIKQALDRMS